MIRTNALAMEHTSIALTPVVWTHSSLSSGSKRLPARKQYNCPSAKYESLLYSPYLSARDVQFIRRESSSYRDPFCNIPEEVISMVLENFSALELVTVSSVCRRWRRLCDDNRVWRYLVESERYYMPYSLPLHMDWKKIYIEKHKMYKVYQGIEDIQWIKKSGSRTFQASLTDNILLRIDTNGVLTLIDCRSDQSYAFGKDEDFYREFSHAISREQLTFMPCGRIDNGELVLGFYSGEVAIVDLESFESKRILAFTNSSVCQVEISRDYIVARSTSHKIAIIDRLNPGAKIIRINPKSEVVDIDVVDNSVFASTAKWGVVAWSIETKKRTVFNKHRPTHLFNTKISNRLIYGSRALGWIEVLDMETKKVTHRRSFVNRTVFGVYDYIAAVGNADVLEFVHILTGDTLASYKVKDFYGNPLKGNVIEMVSFNFKHCVVHMKDGLSIVLTFRQEFDQVYLECLAP